MYFLFLFLMNNEQIGKVLLLTNTLVMTNFQMEWPWTDMYSCRKALLPFLFLEMFYYFSFSICIFWSCSSFCGDSYLEQNYIFFTTYLTLGFSRITHNIATLLIVTLGVLKQGNSSIFTVSTNVIQTMGGNEATIYKLYILKKKKKFTSTRMLHS